MLLKECHDGPFAGHGGAKRTTTFLKKSYYWPNLKDDVEEYVKTSLTCQQNWALNKKNMIVATKPDCGRVVGKCVHGFHGEFTTIKGF
jgi:hypothetical protein